MASMQFYKEEGKEFDYYSYGNQKPTTYSTSYCDKEKCYETKPGMMGYGASQGFQHGSNPCGPMMGHGTGHNTHGMGYGTGYDGTTHGTGYGLGHNGTHGMGYGTGHNNTHSHGYGNHNMHKPGSNGLGMGLGLGTNTPLSHVMGFGKKHEGHSSYGMGSSGCTTYKKQHRRRKGMGGYGSGSDCSDGSDDERRY
ncbi:uncharacterized protein LOC129890154 [Solanum dulcamara]|uniref:uncharacterized protein LOC129890154 n=1 Tax=Solanum dulcamara TaxID=45834 RepID=UPI0024864C98|nr:uncharacterized protein LOC129890154 [Solanum dulcamara]